MPLNMFQKASFLTRLINYSSTSLGISNIKKYLFKFKTSFPSVQSYLYDFEPLTYLLRQVSVWNRFVGCGAEADSGETVLALQQIPRAVRWAENSNVRFIIAIVIAGDGQISACAERNGRKSLSSFQQIPDSGSIDGKVSFAVAVEISLRR